jgi:hypothetical protein
MGTLKMISVSDSTLVLKSRCRIFSLVIDHRLVERASSGEALVQSHRAALGIGERFLDPLGRDQVLEAARVTRITSVLALFLRALVGIFLPGFQSAKIDANRRIEGKRPYLYGRLRNVHYLTKTRSKLSSATRIL